MGVFLGIEGLVNLTMTTHASILLIKSQRGLTPEVQIIFHDTNLKRLDIVTGSCKPLNLVEEAKAYL